MCRVRAHEKIWRDLRMLGKTLVFSKEKYGLARVDHRRALEESLADGVVFK